MGPAWGRTDPWQTLLSKLHVVGVKTREPAIYEIAPHLAFQVVVASVEQMLDVQHPNDNLGRCARSTASWTLRPPRLESACATTSIAASPSSSSSIFRSQSGHSFRPATRFEQTPLALSTLNHARSLLNDHARAM